MAIVKYGTTIVGVRGTIDGITYSANKGGNYAKGWSRSSNPRTTPQMRQRNIAAEQAARWRNLTAAERTAWNTWAALPAQQRTNSLGIVYNISGFAWFVALNTNLYNAGDALTTAAPVLARPAPITISAIIARTTGTPGDSSVQTGSPVPLVGLRTVVLSHLASSLGQIVATPRDLLKIGIVSDPNFRTIITTQFPARYGTIRLGMRLFVLFGVQNAEGYRSTFVAGNNATQNV